MLFKTNFKVIEIRESGVRITHYLRGNRHDVKEDVEAFKKAAKEYEMIDKKALIVWM